MIGSFWNLCRACPSMPVDKLHSEYRSTYRWHEYTGGSRPEVIRKPPIANQFGAINEPPLPRRKKCPELAYKTHEFISCDQQQQQQLPPPSSTLLKNEYNTANRARSEARTGTPSRRSKSEGPHRIPNGFVYPINDRDDAAINKDPNGVKAVAAGESSGLFKKTISKLSTEYRLQFIWPYTRKETNINIPNNNNYQINNNYNHNNTNQCTTDVDAVDFPKKSLSMGAIKATQSNAMPTVHKKRTTHEKEATTQELEPLFNYADENRKETKNRSNTRPFSQYGVNDVKYRQIMTEKENFGFSDDANIKPDNKMIVNGIDHTNNISLYRNVVELRKKAGEYRNRGWGGEFKPDLYNKHKALLDQVSRRSSLSALSLASTVHRPISKEEKDKENTKKTSPSKSYGRYNNIRHHLERTTGPDVEEGTLLPSPTREKLQPTIPKSKEDESYNSQRGSPKKNAASSRHGSPQKSPKKILKQARSQSVGPTVTNTDGSPKRRAGSAVPTAAGTPSSNNAIVKTHKKTPVSTPTIVERRPRPTTLSTSNHSRSKSSTLPLSSTSGKANHLSGPTTGIHHQQIQSLQNDSNTTIKKLSPASLTIPNLKKAYRPITKPQHQRPKSMIVSGHNDPMTESTINFDQLRRTTKGQQKKTAENEDDTDKDGYGGFGGTSISSASPQPPHDHIIEHIVKSPPEPTRVKSPEQIIMRSPDPVNWTVPLDTGKTFTVTQNVRDGILGESIVRPQSEFKAASISSDIKPISAPQSAPPELAEQANMEAWKNEKEPQNEIEIKSEISSASMSTAGTTSGTPSTAIGSTATSVGSTVQPNDKAPTTATTTTTAQSGTSSTMPIVPDVRFDKPVPGTTLRCLDDPTFDPEINSPGTGNTRGGTITQTDVLEKARDRFDRFWGSNKEENV